MTHDEPPPPPPSPEPRRPDDDATAAAAQQAVAESLVTARRIRELNTLAEQLVSQVAAIGAQLTQNTRRHADLAAAVSEDLAPRLAAVQQLATEEFGKLRGEVDVLLAERQEREKARNPPINWAALTAAQAAAQWPILARWVGEVLVPRYALTRDELPDCWAMHAPIVAELSWLRTGYVAAYLNRSSPQLAADWHTRWRPAVMARIREISKPDECMPGRHAPSHSQPLQMPEQPAPLSRSHQTEPRCWWPFYERAYELDLAMRREREDEGQPDWAPAAAAR